MKIIYKKNIIKIKNNLINFFLNLKKKGHGAPAREPVVGEEEQKKMMAYYYKKQEEMKVYFYYQFVFCFFFVYFYLFNYTS
jgi:hypothetical protein